jgi:hypothetical protein
METKDKCPYNNGHESMLLLVVDTDAIIFIIMKMPIEGYGEQGNINQQKHMLVSER